MMIANPPAIESEDDIFVIKCSVALSHVSLSFIAFTVFFQKKQNARVAIAKARRFAVGRRFAYESIRNLMIFAY